MRRAPDVLVRIAARLSWAPAAASARARGAASVSRPAFSAAAARALLAEKDAQLAAAERELRGLLAVKDALLAGKDAMLAGKDAQLAAADRELHGLLSSRDAQLAAADRELHGLLSSRDAQLAAADRELQGLLSSRDAQLAAADRELQGLLESRDALLREKDARLSDRLVSHARELAIAMHAADLARGVLNVRGLFEACVADVWRESGGLPDDRGSVSDKLRQLLAAGPARCPGLVAYMKVAAADNGVPEHELLRQAGRLYEVLSERLHSDAASGAGTTSLPAAVFERSGRATMLALAAFVRFTGRNLALYGSDGKAQRLRLRAVEPLTSPCKITQEQLRHLPAEDV